MLKQAGKEALFILVAAAAIGLAVHAVRPDKTPTPTGVKASVEKTPSADTTGGGVIDIEAAFALHREKKAIFADARHALDYAAGHVSGAVNLPLDESAAWLPGFLTATDPQTVIVTYCDGETCHLAPELAELLFFNGFDHVFYLENGWTRWRDRGYPVE